MTTTTLAHPTPALLTEPYADRLARWFALHPDDAESRVVDRGQCATCGTTMTRTARPDLTDSTWSADDGTLRGGVVPGGHGDGWAWLDWAAVHDVAVYSAAKAHHDLTSSWPWEHQHVPAPRTADPDALADAAAMEASFIRTYGIHPTAPVTSPVQPR
ncbi:hypothetical protein [Cellulosimicrobium sp. Marseille-Q4280]|uniref:hypothetical protein n=1 Tax=Cellulosimicrobium sp. Marseille-Q4280 TaxID=2937992 RepID=UPI0020416354|nr:hypothetical protein [Cellulosimicrobium sp. Marseille-Q4280]